MQSKIQWASRVVFLRKRFHEHLSAVEAGDRSDARRAALRSDADELATIIEETEAEQDGAWGKLYDRQVELMKRCMV